MSSRSSWSRWNRPPAVRTRTRLLGELELELIAHETVEEDPFYPALRAHSEAAATVRRHEQHGVVDALVGPLKRIPVSDPTWSASARRMRDSLESHFLEEESELFELARRTLDSAELPELGLRMAERKTAVVRELTDGRPETPI